MAKNNEVGKQGEDIAVYYLEKQENWTILERNWRYRRAEIDIIAREGNTLVFVEVKTRSYVYQGNQPEDYVSPAKETLLQGAAGAYMEKINYDWEIRFDILSILLHNNGSYEIKHLKDAFF
jgi:putative endonuclease